MWVDTIPEENSSQKSSLEKSAKTEDVDYDHLLCAAGEFGRYQVCLFLSTLPFYFFGAFTYFGQMFMTEISPNHWCWIPELENLTAIERRTLAIPPDLNAKYGYSQCQQYTGNWSSVLAGQPLDPTWATTSCQHGWEFNKTEIPYPTISSEMGWVCDKDSYQATAQSIFFVGSVVGGCVVGWLADRFGRLPAAVFSNVVGCVAGVASIYTTDFLQFAICRFFVGISYDNCMMMVYLLVIEYVAPKYRTMIANLPFALFFTTAACVLPWIALACGHWKAISLAVSVPMALALLAPFIMPESPRWLISKGRIDDAIQKAVDISKVNKKEIPPKLIEQFRKTAAGTVQDKGTLIDIMKRPLLRRTFICITINYACCMLVFDALLRTIGSLQFDFFLSFTVISLTECPSLMLISFISDITGRKLLTLISLGSCALFAILTVVVGSGLPSVLCSVAARFAVNMACNTSMQWTAEILPTPVRGFGMSIIHICGFIATLIAPFIVLLDVYAYWLPLVIIGAIAIIGALVSLWLPESAKKEMPQTFDDAEEMVRSLKLFELPRKNKPLPSASGHENISFEMN